ncbi:MAG: hypothetical protein OEM91_03790 [Hyphomicrobiales bacterium]|nr:hypothetical protein [Hyphomicrobiales bacterium]
MIMNKRGSRKSCSRLWTCLAAIIVAMQLFYPAEPAAAQETFEPLVLSEAQMTRYLAALPEMASVYSKMRDKPVPEIQTALRAVVKKHDFEDFEKFKRMSDTITVVMSGIDPQTKAFTEPAVVLEQRIVDMTRAIKELRDELMSSPDTANPKNVEAQMLPFEQLLDDLKDGRGTLPAKTDPQNVELIRKYFVKLVSNALPRKDEQ